MKPSLASMSSPIITLALMSLAYASVGRSLNLLLIGPAILAITAPSVVAQSMPPFACAFATTLNIAIVLAFDATLWLAGDINASGWLACAAVIVCFALALESITALLSQAIDSILAMFFVTMISLAWLTFPIWLAAALAGTGSASVLRFVIPLHPLFAINGVTADRLGVWTQQPRMYHLTPLGQDTAYTLPTSVLSCCIAHLILGAAVLMVLILLGQKNQIKI